MLRIFAWGAALTIAATFPALSQIPGNFGTQRTLEVVRAVDDIAAVADHLHVVAWLWRRHGWEAGLGYLAESRRECWGPAMRALQLYLEVRGEDSDRESLL